jgi:fructose/tagatose bisphosphate aldolase
MFMIDMPLVLHGASGLPPNMISTAINYGICKFNVNTDLREAAIRYMRQCFHPESREKVLMPPLLMKPSVT